MQRKVVRFDRTRRRRSWSLGHPAVKPRSESRRRFRLSDPKVYLKVFILGAGVALLALPFGADAIGIVVGPKTADACRIVRVIDGDTVTLWCPDTGLERTRIIGLDTPEKFSPACPQEFAAALGAEWRLRQVFVGGESLAVSRRGLDRYERRLARLFVDGKDVADTLIESGHARAYSGGAREEWCL